MAMSFGGTSNPNFVASKNTEGLASDFGIQRKAVTQELNSLIDSVSESLPLTAAEYANSFGDSSVLQRLPIVARKPVCRLRSQLK